MKEGRRGRPCPQPERQWRSPGGPSAPRKQPSTALCSPLQPRLLPMAQPRSPPDCLGAIPRKQGWPGGARHSCKARAAAAPRRTQWGLHKKSDKDSWGNRFNSNWVPLSTSLSTRHSDPAWAALANREAGAGSQARGAERRDGGTASQQHRQAGRAWDTAEVTCQGCSHGDAPDSFLGQALGRASTC